MAQKYDMESLRVSCINKLRGVHMTRLKENPEYEDVTDKNRMEIAELRVLYYERRETYWSLVWHKDDGKQNIIETRSDI